MAESYLRRAELLADLGQYEEAAGELAQAAPEEAAALRLLAQVRLAAGNPRQALVAADAAVAADPGDLEAVIARGMALAVLGRVDEAASQVDEILRLGPANGPACTSAAAILALVRNGKVALDAAWEGVRRTPEQPRAHLVLGLVAAGLGLDPIARRAYQEALALDPRLAEPADAVGLARQEQQWYAMALARHPSVGASPPPGSTAGDGLRRMFKTITDRFRA